MLRAELALAGWREEDVAPALLPLRAEQVGLKRISGAFSNAVFFVSYNVPDDAVKQQAEAAMLLPPPTLLLRVYGASTETLLSRRGELLILHTLSSLYEIGVSPRQSDAGRGTCD